MTDKHTIASWTESPYTSYDKRHIVIHHRVRIIRYDETTVDVVHQRREGDEAWKVVEAVELREYGLIPNKIRDGVMSE